MSEENNFRKKPDMKAEDAVVASPSATKEGLRNCVEWKWDSNYSEIDGRIEAPCWMRLWEDDTLEGYMSNCKNAGNPFTLAFNFEIKAIGGFWAVFRVCTRDFLEGGSGSINRPLSYEAFHNRPARRDITY